ncbi:MAG: phage tail protein [Bacteroidales bacterium]|nr:phage tail protein [Bacteroidales bacterium]
MSISSGYIHGSDLLLYVNGVALGHSSSCQVSYSAETDERMTKETSNSGKWSSKEVRKLSVSISAEGFSFYSDTMSYEDLLALWKAGQKVQVKYAYRGEETTRVMSGDFVITSLSEDAPADNDATYSLQLENAGEITITPATATNGYPSSNNG